MADKVIKLTADGLKKLQEELETLTTVKRPEVLERLKEARAQGDLSENSEYDQAREDMGFIDGRIEEIKQMLKHVAVIDEATNRDTVNLGSTVVLEDVEFGDKETYTIVGTVEADPFKGLISNDSPVGAAVIGHKAGDVVVVNAPNGALEYRIVEILVKD